MPSSPWTRVGVVSVAADTIPNSKRNWHQRPAMPVAAGRAANQLVQHTNISECTHLLP